MLFLLRERPVAVVGVGGYVSVPVSIASFLMRKPLFLQEQNASVGIANRFLGKLASRIFLGFEQARDCFPSGKCLFTGNPLRSDFLETDAGNYRSDSDLLLVMGGSQGARAINDMIVTLLPKIQKAYPNLKIIHQTGASEFEKVKSQYHQAGATHHEVVPFIKQVSEVYKKASVVVCRSGALTVSELIHVGRPAIFIPYPRLGQNDQTANAHLVEAAGAGRVVLQGENLADRFWTTFEEVYRPSTLREMHGRYSKLRTNGALATIGDQIEKAL